MITIAEDGRIFVDRRPTRRELLKIISRLQHVIGAAKGFHNNDRNPFGFELGQRLLNEAFDLCLAARAFDPPTE